jgi:phospholipid-binding lipoprotein MlaA
LAQASANADPATTSQAAAPPQAPGHIRGDPFEAMNRRFFNLNQRIDHAFLAPGARAYKRRAPGSFQRIVNNFFRNLSEPVVFANDGLQLRPKRVAISAFRFVTNSTVGVGGLFDVAVVAGAAHHDNGFGTTLGRWGVPPGPYLYLPLLGPSDLRDSFGDAVDGAVIDPMNWVGYHWVFEHAPGKALHHDYQNRIPYRNIIRTGLAVAGGIAERANVDDDLDAIMSTATDPYATFRSLYLQSRAAAVRESHWFHGDLPDFDTPDIPADTPPKSVSLRPAPAVSTAAPVGGAAPIRVGATALAPPSGPPFSKLWKLAIAPCIVG